jgi:tetratricopeptide (TPR) repeat protein
MHDVKLNQALMYNNIALCHLKRSEFQEGLYYLNLCLDLEPNNVKALYRKAQVYLNLKHYSKAISLLQESLARFP